jgi:hypothetical protein
MDRISRKVVGKKLEARNTGDNLINRTLNIFKVVLAKQKPTPPCGHSSGGGECFYKCFGWMSYGQD